jgi:two-component sensor histidine kinase
LQFRSFSFDAIFAAMRRPIARLVVLPFVLVFSLAISCRAADAPEGPRAVHGELDLRGWDFSAGRSLSLEGEWEFFPGLLGDGLPEEARVYRGVPDRWDSDEAVGSGGRGAGTYRLTIHLPADHPALALRWWTVSTSCEIEADGRTLAKIGSPSIDATGSVPNYRPGMAYIETSGNDLVLSARVSNHEYRCGGLWRAFVLGSLREVARERMRDIAASLVLAAAIAAMAIASLFFFLYNRRQSSALFFSLLAFVVAFRPLVIGDYCLVGFIPGISYSELLRLEYFTIFGGYLAGVAYILSLFGLLSERRTAFLLLAPALPFILLDAFAPIGVLSRCLFPFLTLIVPALVYLGLRIAPIAYRNRELGSWPMIAGTLAIFGGAIHDAVAALMRVNAPSYIVWSLGLFVLFQSALLARLFGRNQRRLEDLVAEKESLLLEVYHRVRNSLQIVSSILAMQANRSVDRALKTAYSSIRDRIRAISLAHDYLYQVGTRDLVDLSGYCAKLLRFMDEGSGMPGGRGRISFDAESVEVPAELCIDCGLILTELVGETFERASESSEEAPEENLSVAIRSVAGGVDLEVSGSGRRFPEELGPDGKEVFGRRIIKALVDKYRGSVTVTRGELSSVRIRLELGEPEARRRGRRANAARSPTVQSR